MTDLVRESRFEIVSAGRAVCGKLQRGAVFGSRPRVDADIGFDDSAGFGIEKDARAAGGRIGIEKFVLRSDGNRHEVHAVATFWGTNGRGGGPGHDKVDVCETGPACKCAF